MRPLPVELIDPDPDQPRTACDEEGIRRLAASLRHFGQLQPIIVRPGREPGRFTIVSGERRWRAAVEAGMSSIVAVLLGRPVSSPRLREIQLTENALREDLTPLDQALAYDALMRHHGWSTRDLADYLHVHHTTIAKAIRLIQLPERLLGYVRDGRLAPTVAAEIGRLRDEDQRDALARRVVEEQLTRQQTVAAVHELLGKPTRAAETAPPEEDDDHLIPFRTKWGLVTIRINPGGGLSDLIEAVKYVMQVLEMQVRMIAADEAESEAGPA